MNQGRPEQDQRIGKYQTCSAPINMARHHLPLLLSTCLLTPPNSRIARHCPRKPHAHIHIFPNLTPPERHMLIAPASLSCAFNHNLRVSILAGAWAGQSDHASVILRHKNLSTVILGLYLGPVSSQADPSGQQHHNLSSSLPPWNA